jgi:hypothetical protein
VDRHGSDQSVINKLLALTEIWFRSTQASELQDLIKSQKITKLSVTEVDGYSFGALDSNTMQCLYILAYVDYLMEVVSHEKLHCFVPERQLSF